MSNAEFKMFNCYLYAPEECDLVNEYHESVVNGLQVFDILDELKRRYGDVQVNIRESDNFSEVIFGLVSR